MADDTPPLDIDAIRIAWFNTLAVDDYPDNDDEVLLLKSIPALLTRLEQAEARAVAAEQLVLILQEQRNDALMHLAAIDAPETILYDEDHPNGLTPAMRALRQAIAQRDVQRRMNQKLLNRNAAIREERDQARERERNTMQLLADIKSFHRNYKGLSAAWHWDEIEERIENVLAQTAVAVERDESPPASIADAGEGDRQ